MRVSETASKSRMIHQSVTDVEPFFCFDFWDNFSLPPSPKLTLSSPRLYLPSPSSSTSNLCGASFALHDWNLSRNALIRTLPVIPFPRLEGEGADFSFKWFFSPVCCVQALISDYPQPPWSPQFYASAAAEGRYLSTRNRFSDRMSSCNGY